MFNSYEMELYSDVSKNGLKLVCNVNIAYGNLKSENSQDYAQQPRRNCTFYDFGIRSNKKTYQSIMAVLSSALRIYARTQKMPI